MKDSFYEDDDGWYGRDESGCLSCGVLMFRESRIDGICEECMEELDLDVKREDSLLV